MSHGRSVKWTDHELEQLRTRMAGAKRQGTWLSAAEVDLVVRLVALARRLTMTKGWSGVPEGHLPTIGDTRAQGIRALYVACDRPDCGSRRRFAFDDLGLPDSTVFVEIPKRRRFRCIRCGGRTVTVMADWPNPLEKTTSKQFQK